MYRQFLWKGILSADPSYIHTYISETPKSLPKAFGYPVPCTYHAHPQFVGQVKIDFIEASLGIPKTEPVSPLCVIPNLVLSIQFSCCRYDTGLEFIIHTSDAPVDCKLPKAQVPSQFIPGSLHQAQCLQDVFDIGWAECSMNNTLHSSLLTELRSLWFSEKAASR